MQDTTVSHRPHASDSGAMSRRTARVKSVYRENEDELLARVLVTSWTLVTGRTPSGDPDGCSPDMARAIAARLGVPVQMVPYAKPGELADDAEKDKWDIGLIGAEPARAEKIDFTAAYVEIEATYLVPAGSPIKSISEVDVKGNRIAVTARSAKTPSQNV